MSSSNLGKFAKSIQFMLIIVNLVFFLMGLIVFIIAAVLKWTTVFNKFINIQEIETLVKLGSVESVNTLLLVMGVFAMILSLMGILGAKYTNRFLLLSYEVVLVLVFLIHAISALVILGGSSKLEEEFRGAMSKTIDTLNEFYNLNDTTNDVFVRECQLLRDLSTIFLCCGGNSPSDFTNTTLVDDCCSDYFDIGCTDKVVNDVVMYSKHMIVIPSFIILTIELLAIIMVPFLLRRIKAENSGYEPT
jgi:hypothetical protein